MAKGVLLIVSGLSGAGKGTICKRLLSKYPDYDLSVSATDRAPREGETNGAEYFFINTGEFEQMIKDGKLLEYARYVDHYYGTPLEWVNTRLEEGRDIILEIEIQGALQVREKRPDSLLVFIMPPDMEELERRLRKRGTETEEEIGKRLARAAEEVEYIKEYDHVIVNEDVEKSVDMLHNIVRSKKEERSGD